MALSGSEIGAGAGAIYGSMVPGIGTIVGAGVGGGLGGLLGNMFGGSKDSKSGPSLEDILNVINQYTYQPKMTGQTESSLYDLFQRMTGQGNYAGATGNGDASAIPFDIGLPTSGLYDALTRGVKEQYLGTAGGPESGIMANDRAYYNNLGVPTYAANQERLAGKDLNNTLVDTAAQLNNDTKNRLLSVLNLGTGAGENLYSQDLAQQRANAEMALRAMGLDIGTQETIRQANQGSLDSLLGGTGLLQGYNSGSTSSNGLLSFFNNLSTGTQTGSGSLTDLLKGPAPTSSYYNNSVPGIAGAGSNLMNTGTYSGKANLLK